MLALPGREELRVHCLLEGRAKRVCDLQGERASMALGSVKQRPDLLSTKLEAWSKMQRQIIERALEISRKRRGFLDAMRKAIRSGDKDSVFELAKKLTGLSDEKRNRTDPGVN